jgi:hypothetical protein
MADYQTELSQSGTTLYLKPADGFQRSTAMGDSSANTHQFTGSIWTTGSSVTILSDEISISNPPPYAAGSFNVVTNITLIQGFLGNTITDGSTTFYMVNGGTAIAGWNPVTPKLTFEVHYTGSKDPVDELGLSGGGLVADTGGGDVIYYGITATTTTQGHLHYLNENGKWELANANATGSSGNTGAGNAALLAIALGTDPAVHGMLTRGYYNLPAGASSVLVSAWVTGSAVYVYSGSAGDAGKYTCAAPSATDSYTRIVGYCTTKEQIIYFDPDKSWVEIS